jgi:nucleoporin GLE1
MAGSSPARRRSYAWASPQRSVISDILNEDRNSESRHKHLIESAKREHDRVRAEAERVYKEFLQNEEQQRILEEKQKEEDRIRREEQLAAERAKLIALRAKKVEVPPAPPPEPPRQQPAPAPAESTTKSPAAGSASTVPKLPNLLNGTGPSRSPLAQGSPSPSPLSGLKSAQPTISSPLAPLRPFQTTPASSPATTQPERNVLGGIPIQQPNGTSQQAQPTPTAPAPAPGPVVLDRYAVIHKNLKVLRKGMLEQAKSNPALKSRMGDMRREIRKCVGQLTGGGVGVNRQQVINLSCSILRSLVQS